MQEFDTGGDTDTYIDSVLLLQRIGSISVISPVEGVEEIVFNFILTQSHQGRVFHVKIEIKKIKTHTHKDIYEADF